MVPTLGSRGQGWVWIQFPLMAVVLLAAALGPRWPAPVVFAITGLTVAVVGVVVAVRAGRTLGGGLTPMPAPAETGALVTGGPYGVVRHPIYSAGLLVLGGLALAGSWVALVPTALLAVTWALKAVVEERFLRERYPAYGEYARRVRRRLVPGVY